MKIFGLLTVLLIAVSLFPQKTLARETYADPSALLKVTRQGNVHPDIRIVALQNVLKRHNSPLQAYASDYVKYADKNNLDWKLLPAISGVESSFGLHYVRGTHNAYGWGGGYIYFNSWRIGIATISQALKEKYVDRGADTVFKIATVYDPPSTTWAYHVDSFMREINTEYVKLASKDLTPNI